jgi:hypothetical protein
MNYATFRRECVRIGDLVVRRGVGAIRGCSKHRVEVAERYQHYILGYLCACDGKCNMQDIYRDLHVTDLEMYLAVHSLMCRGLIVCKDPYRVHTHSEVEIMLVQNPTDRLDMCRSSMEPGKRPDPPTQLPF